MPYIDVRVEFDAEEEEGYTHYSPKRVSLANTDLPEGALQDIGESAGQSDLYTVGVSNAMLSALGGDSTEKISYY